MLPYFECEQLKTKEKAHPMMGRAFLWCLAVTYFRVRMHTIIGAEAFHGPVRDGKGWGHLAIAAKRNWLSDRLLANFRRPTAKNREEVGLRIAACKHRLLLKVIGSSRTVN